MLNFVEKEISEIFAGDIWDPWEILQEKQRKEFKGKNEFASCYVDKLRSGNIGSWWETSESNK